MVVIVERHIILWLVWGNLSFCSTAQCMKLIWILNKKQGGNSLRQILYVGSWYRLLLELILMSDHLVIHGNPPLSLEVCTFPHQFIVPFWSLDSVNCTLGVFVVFITKHRFHLYQPILKNISIGLAIKFWKTEFLVSMRCYLEVLVNHMSVNKCQCLTSILYIRVCLFTISICVLASGFVIITSPPVSSIH